MDPEILRMFPWGGWIINRPVNITIRGEANNYVEEVDGVIGPREGVTLHILARYSVEADDGTVITLDVERLEVLATRPRPVLRLL